MVPDHRPADVREGPRGLDGAQPPEAVAEVQVQARVERRHLQARVVLLRPLVAERVGSVEGADVPDEGRGDRLRRRIGPGRGQSVSTFSIGSASFSGLVVGPKRSTTWPSASTRNLVKFHLMRLPSTPDFCPRSH